MDSIEELLRKVDTKMRQEREAIEADCRSQGCQCLSCGAYALMCCAEGAHLRRMKCPDDPAYSPRYRCPDFVEKEEPDNES